MKFCDKLAKQRKNNNLSQEQLADKLGVSRQAVSKWESGSSYPDMEKIIQISNILNCTLEDLLDDGTIKSNSYQHPKASFNNYLQDLLKFVTKTYNMFCSMQFKQRIKCIFEVLILILIVTALGGIAFAIIRGITASILSFIPYPYNNYVIQVFEAIYITVLLILGFIIVLHLFKIRYLDYYITIEDKNAEKKTLEKEVLDKHEFVDPSKREKVIIRDPKHASFSFFSLLGKIMIYAIKIFVAMCTMPLICLCLFLVFLMVVSIAHIRYTILFLFITIAFSGSVLLSFLILYFIYNFIFNRKQPLKVIFILFISSLALMGVGAGLSCTAILNYDYYDIEKVGKVTTKTEKIEVTENIRLYLLDRYPKEFVIDNTQSDIQLEISYPEILNYHLDHNKVQEYQGKYVDEYHLYVEDVDILEMYKIVLNHLKRKRLIRYDEDAIHLKIYISQANYDKLFKNDYK
ncbi:MAG: helix-turn-helix domain-containing protein [Bacilli bacterium]|nr:helix-turn-helix domain-containing protein [Bacilli bacterium]